MAILLVDDDEAVLRVVQRVLRVRGYEVVSAPSGYEALRLFEVQSGEFDVLLTDMIMPGVQGRELADEILRRKPGIKVLYMSGYTEDDALRRGDLGTGQAFIQKPFTLDELDQRLQALLALA
ncbi:MAG: response regulator [Gemmatimonadota bacterium]